MRDHVDPDEEAERLLDLLAAADDPRQSQLIYQRLVEGHLGLVNTIASGYRGRGVEWDDLVQVGRLGLCKAITGYRKGKGPCFRAYAVPTINGQIKKHFRDHVWAVRPPRRLQELQRAMRDGEEALGQELGHTPSGVELAAALRVDQPTLRETQIARRLSRAVSLDVPVESGTAWAERLPADQDEQDGQALVEARLLLRPAIKVLAPRQRQILYLRFVCGCTQQEIGDRLGVSQMQVSRLLRRILDTLRAQLAPASEATTVMPPAGRPVA